MTIVSYEHDGSVGRVVIDRPERRNAINYTALDELRDAVDTARGDGVRALVITGTEGHFCAGADLSELEDKKFAETLRSVLDSIAGLPVPTIAAISGACMGLGMQLAMSCDLRIADRTARFAVPVAKLGLMVDYWTIRRLAALAGHSTARQMVVTARPIDAERAHQVGFVQWLVGGDGDEHPDPLSLALEIADDVVRLAPLSIAGSKLGLDLVEADVASPASEELYREAFERAWASSDLIEGQSAFNERRTPNFEGR